MPPNRTPTPGALKLIRASLVAGVLVFGAVVWYLLRAGAPDRIDEDAERTLRIIFIALAVLDLPILFALRSAQARATDVGSAARLAIAGWALGESVALFGGVVFLLTGRRAIYLLGLLVLFTALAMLPVPEPERTPQR